MVDDVVSVVDGVVSDDGDSGVGVACDVEYEGVEKGTSKLSEKRNNVEDVVQIDSVPSGFEAQENRT